MQWRGSGGGTWKSKYVSGRSARDDEQDDPGNVPRATSTTVSGLKSCSTYSFRIAAEGDGGTYAHDYGPWSSASATTGCPTATPTATAIPTATATAIPMATATPPAPSGFSVTKTSTTSVNVSWSSLSGADRYQVDWKASTGPWWTNYVNSPTTSQPYTVIPDCDTYRYRVRANGDGTTYADAWGEWASTISVEFDNDCDDELEPPPAPDWFGITVIDHDSVRLNWAVRSGVIDHRVRFRQFGTEGWDGSYSPDGVETFGDLLCSPSPTRRRVYEFRVRAFGDGITYAYDYGDYTSILTARMPVCPPPPPADTPVVPPGDDGTTYADLIGPRSGKDFDCQPVLGLGTRKKHSSSPMRSSDNRHKTLVEMYAFRDAVDLLTYCVDFRFIAESTPGAHNISWSGKGYKLEKRLDLSGLTDEQVLELNRPQLLRYFRTVTPDDSGITPDLSDAHSCTNCRGGTLAMSGRWVT